MTGNYWGFLVEHIFVCKYGSHVWSFPIGRLMYYCHGSLSKTHIGSLLCTHFALWNRCAFRLLILHSFSDMLTSASAASWSESPGMDMTLLTNDEFDVRSRVQVLFNLVGISTTWLRLTSSNMSCAYWDLARSIDLVTSPKPFLSDSFCLD